MKISIYFWVVSNINVFVLISPPIEFRFNNQFFFFKFQKNENQFLNKKINLGLDLQGGSYLLLEINSDSLVEEKIQSKVIPIKKLLKDNRINYDNFKVNKNSLSLNLDKY